MFRTSSRPKFVNTNLKHGGKPRCACKKDIRHMDVALVFCYHTVRGASNNVCTPKDLNSRLSRKYNQDMADTQGKWPAYFIPELAILLLRVLVRLFDFLKLGSLDFII